MNTLLTPQIQAVDVNLQAVAAESLHWFYHDETHVELRKPIGEKQLDGFGKQATQLLGVIRHDAKTDLHFGFVHAQPGLVQTPPELHVCSRYLLQMAQEDMIGFLTDIKRL